MKKTILKDGIGITIDELIEYVKNCNNRNSLDKDGEFHPYRILVAIADNEEYDPDGFSQEIEDSEKNMVEV